MGDKSKIEWTEASWTPIRARNKVTGKIGWHCEHATPGCEFCYAESMNKRLGTGLPFKPGHRKDIEIFLDEKMLTQPLRWSRGRVIFVCSMTDLFADFVPDEWIDRVFAVMALAPQHTFQVLTKRAERMHRHLRNEYGALEGRIFPHWQRLGLDRFGHAFKEPQRLQLPLPNVWLGVSAEDQKRADERIPHLLQTPAAVRFISAEPLLGEINLQKIALGTSDATFYGHLEIKHAAFFMDALRGVNKGAIPALDWIIVGGESGPNARPMHPDWARSIRDQCQAAGVRFFFKQWGEHDGHNFPIKVGKRAAGRLLDGREHNEMPEKDNG